MSFRQMKTNEVALLLHGLRAVYIADEEAAHDRLTKMLEAELASRGMSLPQPGPTVKPKVDMRQIFANGDNTHRFPG